MKTADLIETLAADAAPVRGRPPAPLLASAALVGAAISAGILVVWLGLRPLEAAAHSPPFWMKAAYTLALGGAGWMAVARLARPGGRIGIVMLAPLLAFAWLAALAGLEEARMAPGGMAHLWLGQSWAICPLRILVLAAPVLAGLLWAMQRTAPTRPALAGAAAGLMAGGLGAAVYGLYCQETAAAFVVVWYSMGIAAVTAVGALIGARLLRW